MTDFSSKFITEESSRCLRCKNPQCSRACPVGNLVPMFLQNIAVGNFDLATQIIGHPFGEVCGYVCPHDKCCQGNCVLGKTGQPVKMGELERTIFAEHPYKVERKTNKCKGLKLAVIGGGVSGITCAVKLYEQGADVTIYEREDLLSTLKLIPDFRLPRGAIERIEREIDGKFTIVKKDIGEADVFIKQSDGLNLLYAYNFVYIATGAGVKYKLGIDGEELATPYDEFLKNKAHTGDVVVIGGGNTAVDCARVAKHSGCNATIAYRRTRVDMPAFNREIDDADSEGVKFTYNVAPVKIERNGSKLAVTLAKTISEGRDKLTVTDDTTVVECDTVVSALGAKFDDSIYGEMSYIFNKMSNPINTVYVGGDALGARTVAHAVADGILAAKQIVEQYS